MRSNAVLRMRRERSDMSQRQREQLSYDLAVLRGAVGALRGATRAELLASARARRAAADGHLADLITAVNGLVSQIHADAADRRAERARRLGALAQSFKALRTGRDHASRRRREDTRACLARIRADSLAARIADFRS